MVTPGFYPIQGGTETMVRNLSLSLNKIGVHTDVMTFNMDQKWDSKWKEEISKIDQSTIFRIPGLNWLPITHPPRVVQGINLIPGKFTYILKQYDIIHYHEVDFSFPLFSFFVKKPKILHIHGLDAGVFCKNYISRMILKHVSDLYISLSRQNTKELVELGIPSSKIIYLPNAIDTTLFHPQGEKEDGLILFVGRIFSTKGLHVLIESLRYLKKNVI